MELRVTWELFIVMIMYATRGWLSLAILTLSNQRKAIPFFNKRQRFIVD